jgi:hypothetical protein
MIYTIRRFRPVIGDAGRILRVVVRACDCHAWFGILMSYVVRVKPIHLTPPVKKIAPSQVGTRCSLACDELAVDIARDIHSNLRIAPKFIFADINY